MKIRKGFVSNSSSCSFYCDLSPEEATQRLHKVIDFINELKGTKLEYSDFFYMCFKADDDQFITEYDFECMSQWRIKEFKETIRDKTVIYAKVEDNQFRTLTCDIIEVLLDAKYNRHDNTELIELITPEFFKRLFPYFNSYGQKPSEELLVEALRTKPPKSVKYLEKINKD